MFSLRKLIAAGSLVAAFMASTAASAAPITQASFGVTGGFTTPSGTDVGNTNSVIVTNGGSIRVSSADSYALSALVTLGTVGALRNLTSISDFTPIINYLTLTSGVTVDLFSLMINGHADGPPGFLNLSGIGVLHAPGFDDTRGILSLSGNTTGDLTFSFAVDASAETNSVPEPRTIALVSIGLLGMGLLYSRRTIKMISEPQNAKNT
jgi:hypothetical protein